MPLPVPDLSDAAVVRAVAGIRPCREGGLRLEEETLQRKLILHNYGHGGCGVTLSLGCAAEIRKMVPETGPVAILGGGVSALAVARELLRAGRQITLYADRVGIESTSAIAGALWLPTGIDFPEPGPDRRRFNQILRDSYKMFEGLMALSSYRETIEELAVFEPEGSPDEAELFESGAFSEPIEANGPMPGSMRKGRHYRTLFIHTPDFLGALQREVTMLGGRFERRRFDSLDDVLSLTEPTVVNGLALGSRTLFGDEAIYPARGILVHLTRQQLGYVVHDGYRYLFPRRDALILGGTYEPGIDSTEVSQAAVNEILEHHRAFFAS